MTFKKLLAKSQRQDEPWREQMWLPVHLADVWEAAGKVLDSTADQQLSALGLAPEEWRERLRRSVLLAAALHDLGKANDHFQGMIYGIRKDQPQGLRHEWVTLLMMDLPLLHEWLMPAVGNNACDWQIVQWAIAGHHPAYNRSSPPRLAVDGAGHEIRLLLGHNDFGACLSWLGRTFNLDQPPLLGENLPLPLVGMRNVFAAFIQPWFRTTSQQWDRLTREERRLVAAVKNCLVAGDVAGSALPQDVADPAKRAMWIGEAFQRVPAPQDLREIITDRLIDKSTRRVQELRPFQRAVADEAGEVTLAKAGCGTGKTIAAYHWAGTRHPNRRLYFCYPTTGTATEGFRDYLVSGENPKFHARLFHGRASVDLDIIQVRGDDPAAEADAVARIESLDAWSTPIVCCTVDTVLGIVQNNRRGLYAWPALAGAAFVFDEIHAYDDRLFGALLRFLQALPGVPVLLMTASLPKARKAALAECLKRLGRTLHEVPGPKDLEDQPRYHRQGDVDDRDPLPEVQAELERGGKVLWVCNTVNRVMTAATAASKVGLTPHIYHSRFRYEDRVAQHKKVIDAFDPEQTPGCAVAICSQVAEMSLDLSATLLVTDLAPVPALIQRLGRLNRKPQEDDPPTRPFIVLQPDGHLPYTPTELEAAEDWLAKFGSGSLSQTQLAQAWEKEDAERRPAHVASAWLDGGPATQVLELREASPGITVVREEDEVDVKAGKAVARVALPMPPPPRAWDWRQWRKVKGLPVAPKGVIDYCPERGAQWA